MNKGFLFGLALGGALFLGSTVSAVFGPIQDERSDLRSISKDDEYRKDLAIATPAEWELETDSQRLVGGLFSAYGETLGRDHIQRAMTRARESGKLEREIYFGYRIDHPMYSEQEARVLLRQLAASSDLIIRCAVVSRRSQLSGNGAFALTQYDVKVEELLKQDGAARVQLGDTVRVVRPGGMLLIEGTVINVQANSFLPLGSGEYLLLLERDESTACYLPTGSRQNFEPFYSSFGISDGRLQLLAEGAALPRTMATLESIQSLIATDEPEMRREFDLTRP